MSFPHHYHHHILPSPSHVSLMTIHLQEGSSGVVDEGGSSVNSSSTTDQENLGSEGVAAETTTVASTVESQEGDAKRMTRLERRRERKRRRKERRQRKKNRRSRRGRRRKTKAEVKWLKKVIESTSLAPQHSNVK